MIARAWILMAAGAIAAYTDDLPAHILALAREEHTIADELKHLPDYTCAETIERFISEDNKPLKLDDRLVIDIAVAHGKELFAWPGQSFEERSIVGMVDHGFITDGDFSTMMHNVFVAHGAQISYSGPEARGGRQLLRYDFHIPVMSSGWRMFSRGRIGVMGALGSFWLDAETLDLVRMRYQAEDMPFWSSDQSVEEDVDYAPIVINDSRLLLPSSARITAVDFSSRKVQNHITFTDCHKYSSESTISFDEPSPRPAAAMAAGITLSVRLEKPIVLARAVIGEEVIGAIAGGGSLKGIVRSVDRHTQQEIWWVLGIEWAQPATLQDISPFPGFRRDLLQSISPLSPGARADLTYISVTGRRAVIPAGVKLTLRTALAPM